MSLFPDLGEIFSGNQTVFRDATFLIYEFLVLSMHFQVSAGFDNVKDSKMKHEVATEVSDEVDKGRFPWVSSSILWTKTTPYHEGRKKEKLSFCYFSTTTFVKLTF